MHTRTAPPHAPWRLWSYVAHDASPQEEGYSVSDCAQINPASNMAVIDSSGAVSIFQMPAASACPFDIFVWIPTAAQQSRRSLSSGSTLPCGGQLGVEEGSSIMDGKGGTVQTTLVCPQALPPPAPPLPPPPASPPPDCEGFDRESACNRAGYCQWRSKKCKFLVLQEEEAPPPQTPPSASPSPPPSAAPSPMPSPANPGVTTDDSSIVIEPPPPPPSSDPSPPPPVSPPQRVCEDIAGKNACKRTAQCKWSSSKKKCKDAPQ